MYGTATVHIRISKHKLPTTLLQNIPSLKSKLSPQDIMYKVPQANKILVRDN